MSIEKKFLESLVPIVKSGHNSITVAYSGGVDSHVVLHLAYQLKSVFPELELKAFHVNHGLSPNADSWQEHCHNICETLSIPFEFDNVEVDLNAGKGLEAAAREARYVALYKGCQEKGVLLLGQHRNDQVETLLLQLKRGAGPKGLSAMAAQSVTQEGIRVVRPLLDCSRDEIEKFATQNNLNWIEDESNQSLDFDRNFLRSEIIPLLERRWPGFSQAASRSARHCSTQQSLIEEACLAQLADIESEDGGVIISAITSRSQAWQAELLRCWLMKQNADIPSEKVLQQFQGLMLAKEDANPEIVWGQWQAKRFRGVLYVMRQTAKPLPQSQVLVNGVELCFGKEIGKVRVSFSSLSDKSTATPVKPLVSARYDGFSRRFKPLKESMSKPLNQWFKQWNIPPWQRERTPQIYVGDALVALVTQSGLVLNNVQVDHVCKDLELELVRPEITA